LTAVDTSVVVAAFAAWHSFHDQAAEALAKGPRLIAHVATETFAVLTRLPPPYRTPTSLVVDFLAANFPHAPIALRTDEYAPLFRLAAQSGIRGGAVYDALVAATARQEGLPLLTLDQRALPTYERVGATVHILE
jgi:predicted nucleic acid-binding protein